METLLLRSVPAGDECAVLCVTGEIDVSTAPGLRDGMNRLVERGAVHLVADLTGVEFLDSTGLNALLDVLGRARASDGSLCLVVRSDRIGRIFRITGLDQAFRIFPSVAQCLAADSGWLQAVASCGQDVEQWCRRHDLL